MKSLAEKSEELNAYIVKHYGSMSPAEIADKFKVSKRIVSVRAHRLGVSESQPEKPRKEVIGNRTIHRMFT